MPAWSGDILPDEQMTIGFGIAVRASNLAGIRQPCGVKWRPSILASAYDVKTLREALPIPSRPRFHLFLLGSFASPLVLALVASTAS